MHTTMVFVQTDPRLMSPSRSVRRSSYDLTILYNVLNNEKTY